TSFSETDRAARLVDIKVHTSAILAKAMDRKSAKALAAQRSFAHTSFMSGISTNLRHRYHTTTCLYVLFELIITRFESNHMDNNPTVIANNLRNLKFTEDSCIDTLAVELNDLMERYRASMTPPTFNAMDAAAISSIDGYTYIWIYHTLCVLSKAFIADTDLWDVIKNYVSTARATRVVMTVTVVVVMTVVMVALVAVTVDVIVLAVMTVTPTVLLLMPSPVTLGTAVLRLLPITPSYHPPSTPRTTVNLFAVRKASDDNISVRFPARDICEITTSFGDVLNAPKNAIGLYSFLAQPKFVGTNPHHGESLHISDLTRFRAMMASFETALRTFLTKYS
ncbi:hypothetical protein DYB34_012116, partial [Aphanomyces astaci]